MPTTWDGLYAQDADLLEFAVGDFPDLTSKFERVAYGTDGAIAAGTFALTSALDFAARGLEAGHVVVLDKAGSSGSRTLLDCLPVVSVATTTATLGRLGLGAGFGAFPAGVTTAAGVTGLTFRAPTCRPQIATATATIKRKLRIDSDDQLEAVSDVRPLCAKMVLYWLYLAEYRQARDDAYRQKMLDLKADIDGEWADLFRIYAPSVAGRKPAIGDLDDLPYPARVPGAGPWYPGTAYPGCDWTCP
jgi:hypothetical protein